MRIGDLLAVAVPVMQVRLRQRGVSAIDAAIDQADADAALEIPVGTLTSRLARARTALQRMLGEGE